MEYFQKYKKWYYTLGIQIVQNFLRFHCDGSNPGALANTLMKEESILRYLNTKVKFNICKE